MTKLLVILLALLPVATLAAKGNPDARIAFPGGVMTIHWEHARYFIDTNNVRNYFIWATQVSSEDSDERAEIVVSLNATECADGKGSAAIADAYTGDLIKFVPWEKGDGNSPDSMAGEAVCYIGEHGDLTELKQGDSLKVDGLPKHLHAPKPDKDGKKVNGERGA